MSRVDKIILGLTLFLALGVAVEFNRLRQRTYFGAIRQVQVFRPRGLRQPDLPIRRAIETFYAFWAVTTVGVALAILRHPPAARRRWPGRGPIAAILSALAAMILIAKDLLWLALAWPPPHIPVAVLFNVVHQVAAIVLGAWIALGLVGQWKARGEWQDRLGRLVGWGWLSYFGYLFLAPVLWG